MYKYMKKQIQIDFKEQKNLSTVTLTISLFSFSLSCDVHLQKLVSEKNPVSWILFVIWLLLALL